MKSFKIIIILLSLLLSFFLGHLEGIKNSKKNDAIVYSFNQGIVKEIDMQVNTMNLLRNNDYPKALEALENWTDLNLCQLQSAMLNNNYALSHDDLVTLNDLKKYRAIKPSHETNKALKSCVNEVLARH